MKKELVVSKVVGQYILNATTKQIDLIAPAIAATAVPGQFVNVQVSEHTAPLLRRPLGIAAVNKQDGTISLMYRVIGEATKMLADCCTGDRLSIIGPLGHGFHLTKQKVLLVGGGLGLAPLLYLAASLEKAQVEVLMGGRCAQDLFWQELYADLAEQLYLTSDDGSLGTKGTVMALLPELLTEGGYACVYVCGPVPMMKAVAAACQQAGVKCQVSLEKYMACGLGACLSCSCGGIGKRLKVCTDRTGLLGGGGSRMVKALYDGRLQTDIAGLKMQTPITTASGTFGFGLEFTDFLDLEKVGAVTVKGTTPLPRAGNSGQRVVETPSGMLNCVGLENPGVDYFLAETLPKLRQYKVPVIVNMAAASPQEYGQLAAKLDVPGVSAVEINISCPNVKNGGLAFGTSCKSAASVVKQVKKNTSKMVITKLSPNVTSISEIALAVEAADAISLINTLLGMKIDIERQCPVLGNVTGGLSGPCVRPVAVRMCYEVAQKVQVPLIGMGGIMNAEDALEFFLAGCSAVAVGTANFRDPTLAETICQGLLAYMDRHQVKQISELVGQALPEVRR